jgi:FHS family L-fucose permease-like MFS transporter
VSNVYLAVAVLVIAIAVLLRFTSLPEPESSSTTVAGTQQDKWYLNKRFLFAVTAQFFYVAAQVGIAAFFINYATDPSVGMGNREAAYLLSVAMILFTVGRFTGSMLMRRFRAGRLLTYYALAAMLLCLWVALTPSPFTAFVLAAVFFFESIMFPTIFALGVKDLGPNTKLASSVIVMSIVGGAVIPYFMGLVAEAVSTAFAYLVPVLCFTVVAAFGHHSRHDLSV